MRRKSITCCRHCGTGQVRYGLKHCKRHLPKVGRRATMLRGEGVSTVERKLAAIEAQQRRPVWRAA